MATVQWKKASVRAQILIVSGAGFTRTVVHDQARHLKQTGRYDLSLLGAADGLGKPGSEGFELFERADPFPTAALRPASLPAAGRLLLDGLRAAVPLGAAWHDRDQVGESGRARVADKIRARLARQHYARAIPSLVKGYDLHHWHTLSPDRLAALDFFPPDARIVISVWGSDLLRASGLETYRRQLRACERASVVTLTSIEMRERFLTRFGRRFEDKVRLASFGSDLHPRIDAARGTRDAFLGEIGIPPTHTSICIGNNATAGNQHVRVLEAVAELPAAILGRIALIVPMTYAGDPDYLAKIRGLGAGLPCPVAVLDQPLSQDEVARLRVASDVMIHVPITDAFSAAMTEHLYAGSVLVTGEWLPFGPLRRKGIPFHAVESLSELGERLVWVVENLQAERRCLSQAANEVLDLAAWDRLVPQWVAVYEELLGSLPPRDAGGSLSGCPG